VFGFRERGAQTGYRRHAAARTPRNKILLTIIVETCVIRHAEYTHSATVPAHFLQIWIEPRHQGNKPRWEQRSFDPAARVGALLPVVSGAGLPGTMPS